MSLRGRLLRTLPIFPVLRGLRHFLPRLPGCIGCSLLHNKLANKLHVLVAAAAGPWMETVIKTRSYLQRRGDPAMG